MTAIAALVILSLMATMIGGFCAVLLWRVRRNRADL